MTRTRGWFLNLKGKWVFLLISLLGISVGHTAPIAESSQLAPTESASVEARLHVLWSAYKEAKLTQSEAARARAFSAISDWRSKGSGEIFETAAYLFLEEGFNDLEKGNLDLAREEFHRAIDLNAHLWPAYSGLAQINLEEKKYLQYLRLGFRGVSEAFSLENAYFFSSAMLWLLGAMVWVWIVFFVAFTLLIILKYARPAYATTFSQMESRFSGFYATAATAVLLAWPFILGLNIYATMALFLFLLFPFFVAKERFVSILLLLGMIALPVVNVAIGHFSEVRNDPLLRAHLTHIMDLSNQERLAFLTENPGEGDLAHRSNLITGYIHASQGQEEEARQRFDQVPKNSPLWPLAEVNRGNLHLAAQDYRQAQATYERALNANADLSEALFNLSLLYDELGNLNQAERYRSQAIEKNPAMRTRVRVSRVSGGSEPVYALPDPQSRVFSALFQPGPRFSQQLGEVRTWIPSIFFALLLVACLVHRGLRSYSLLARICQKCGRIYYKSDSSSPRCSQCISLYNNKADLPIEAKNKKYEEVKAYTKRRRVLFTISQVFLPGAKKILRDHPVSGAFILLVWFLILIPSFAPPTAMTHPYILYLPYFTLPYGLWLGVTVVFWALFGLRPIWKED